MGGVPPPAAPACELCGAAADALLPCHVCHRRLCPACRKDVDIPTAAGTPRLESYCLTCWFAVFTTRQ